MKTSQGNGTQSFYDLAIERDGGCFSYGQSPCSSKTSYGRSDGRLSPKISREWEIRLTCNHEIYDPLSCCFQAMTSIEETIDQLFSTCEKAEGLEKDRESMTVLMKDADTLFLEGRCYTGQFFVSNRHRIKTIIVGIDNIRAKHRLKNFVQLLKEGKFRLTKSVGVSRDGKL
jgi:hypothetical protein